MLSLRTSFVPLLVATMLAAGGCGRDTAPASDLSTARQQHQATVTSDGLVVIAGGSADLGVDLTAPFEVYDASADRWQAGTWASGPRTGHAMARVGDGDVLVVGGGPQGAPGAEAWRLDPHALEGQQVAAMPWPRAQATASALPDGRVMVTGGRDSEGRPTATAAVYDPRLDAWTEVPDLPAARAGHGAVALRDGRVFVFGGEGVDGLLTETTMWSPTDASWRTMARMPRERVDFAATLLTDGSVLMAGGRSAQGWLQSAVRYHPARDRWSDAGRATELGAGSSLAASDDGVLWIGGAQPVSAQYDIGNDAIFRWDGESEWARVGSVHETRARATASVLPDGRVILAGGATTRGRALSSCELLAPAELVAEDAAAR